MLLLDRLRAIVGRRHVIAGGGRAARFATGYRHGGGPVLAVVRPGSLVEQWRVLQVCVATEAIVIMQAANTGLTGGSTPDGVYDRPVVLVNVMRLSTVHLLDDGRQVLCLPGVTLDQLERRLAPLGREPHSVIGSSCFGASVVGGVCNNSGGALLQRGPSYTELALFAQRGTDGTLRLVNRLGVALPDDPEAMLAAVERGDFAPPLPTTARASAADYVQRLRDVDADTPARFNADPTYLHDAAGSAGHVAVFAVRLDTFSAAAETRVFHVATDDPDALADLRRAVLGGCANLPIAAEYMHRDAFRLADDYGCDLAFMIERFGTRRLGMLQVVQAVLTRVAGAISPASAGVPDRVMLAVARRLRRGADVTQRHMHHLLLRCGGAGIAEMRGYLRVMPGEVRECSEVEGQRLFLRRFVAAGGGGALQGGARGGERRNDLVRHCLASQHA